MSDQEDVVEPICLTYSESVGGWTFWLMNAYSQLIVVSAFLVRLVFTEMIHYAKIGSRSQENKMIILPIYATYVITYIIVPMFATWDFTKHNTT